MPKKTLQKKDILAYVAPELESLKGLFQGLGLEDTLLTLEMLEETLDAELDEHYSPAARRRQARAAYEATRDEFVMD